jgi:CBS domain-containing protein
MNTELSTVSPETPLREALKRMLLHKFGCLPVVDAERRVVGILTEADLVRFAAEVIDELDAAGRHLEELGQP